MDAPQSGRQTKRTEAVTETFMSKLQHDCERSFADLSDINLQDYTNANRKRLMAEEKQSKGGALEGEGDFHHAAVDPPTWSSRSCDFPRPACCPHRLLLSDARATGAAAFAAGAFSPARAWRREPALGTALLLESVRGRLER